MAQHNNNNTNNNSTIVDASAAVVMARIDTEVKHLERRMLDFTETQTKHSDQQRSLTENVQQMTYNVGALLKGMEKTELALNAIIQHESRLKEVEGWNARHETEYKSFKQDTIGHVEGTSSRLASLELLVVKGTWTAKILNFILSKPMLVAGMASLFAFINHLQNLPK